MRDSGFTLVEVLVAFVILSLALGASYAALTGALRWEARAEQSAAAVTTARSFLDEAGTVRPLGPGLTDEMLPSGQRVTVETRAVEPFPANGPVRVRAWQVTVRVTDPDGGTVALRELKLAPP